MKQIKLTEEQFNFLKNLLLEYQRILRDLEIVCLFLNISIKDLKSVILDNENKTLTIETDENKF